MSSKVGPLKWRYIVTFVRVSNSHLLSGGLGRKCTTSLFVATENKRKRESHTFVWAGIISYLILIRILAWHNDVKFPQEVLWRRVDPICSCGEQIPLVD